MFSSKSVVLSAACSLASAQTQTAVPSKAVQIAEHSHKAKMYLREKRPDLAIPQLRDVVRLDADKVQVKASLGLPLYSRGQYAPATTAFGAALRLHPGLSRIAKFSTVCAAFRSNFQPYIGKCIRSRSSPPAKWMPKSRPPEDCRA